jgi:hypothetical protein
VLLIVDSIEHDLALCTLPDGRTIDVPLAWLPKDTSPGETRRHKHPAGFDPAQAQLGSTFGLT